MKFIASLSDGKKLHVRTFHKNGKIKSDFSKIIAKAKPLPKVKKKKLPTIKKLKKDLEIISHTYIRKRDGINGEIKGYCFDCGEYVEGQQFQAGHWEASGSSGALLRYHPDNMHGQAGKCNMLRSQERVKIAYTMRMIEKYGLERVEELRRLKQKIVKADRYFYTTLIELYKAGNEKTIIEFLENC